MELFFSESNKNVAKALRNYDVIKYFRSENCNFHEK